MPPDNLVLVRFIALPDPFSYRNRCYCGYSTGEVAAFDPEIAALLIKRGVAVPRRPPEMDASGGVLVRFVANSPPFTHETRCVPGYNAGDVAGFEPMIAALLVKRGIAVYGGPGYEDAS